MLKLKSVGGHRPPLQSIHLSKQHAGSPVGQLWGEGRVVRLDQIEECLRCEESVAVLLDNAFAPSWPLPDPLVIMCSLVQLSLRDVVCEHPWVVHDRIKCKLVCSTWWGKQMLRASLIV